MSRKVLSILVLTVFVLMPAGGAVSAVQENWQYFKELPAASSGFALVKLDAEVMQNCQEDFTDIRITDQQGKEIPCQVIRPGQEQSVHSLNLINSVEYDDGTAAVFDMGENPRPHNQLVLNLAENGDYLREVEILASNDADNWGKLGTGKIFSYHSEHYNQINYPTSTMRYLQVNIRKKPGESSLGVNSAQLRFLSSNIYAGKPLPVSVISNRSNPKTTEVVVDLGLPNYIITGVQIQSADKNFDRNIIVSSSSQSVFTQAESPRVSGRIMAYDFNNYRLNQDSIAVEQFCRRYLMISILNEDSPPLAIQAIKVYGAAPAFIAELAAPSLLWYGNPQAALPSYDLKEYASLIAKTDLPVIEAGPQQINPDYQAPVLPWTEKNKWLLDTAIILVAGGFIIIIMRKFKQLARDYEEE